MELTEYFLIIQGYRCRLRRLRGTLQPQSQAQDHVRFIPAPAGNSDRAPRRPARGTVHPRACGELIALFASFVGVSGSSPRLRGTPMAVATRKGGRRFIPASAGNSSAGQSPPRKPTVHPRVCGELITTEIGLSGEDGSSPRLRGTRGAADLRPALRRFIPASAGNSGARRASGAARPVHPRVCGELFCLARPDDLCNGSSPRLRGTHDGVGHRLVSRRFIPASAGNSRPGGARIRWETVHPRVCGELGRQGFGPASILGSSPRLRGTQLRLAFR